MKKTYLIATVVLVLLLGQSAFAATAMPGGRLTGVNWFGFETSNYVVHGIWTRDYKSMLQQTKDLGFNCIRIPWCNEMIGKSPNGIQINEYGTDAYTGQAGLNLDLAGLDSMAVLDKIIAHAGTLGLKIILDNHSRAANGYMSEALWYTSAYSEARWISDWQMMANRYKNASNVVGFDLDNEPFDAATWGEGTAATNWNDAAARCGQAILAIKPSALIIIEGVEVYNGDTYWWGGNLAGVRNYPITSIPAANLVYSPHEYGPTVYPQTWFTDPTFPNNMPAIWDAHFWFIYKENIAPVFIGEFGIKEEAAANPSSGDYKWFTALLTYLGNQASWTFWCLNPDSGDTGGILKNDWVTVESAKYNILRPYLAGTTPTNNPPTVSLTAPANGATYTAPASVTISATASDTDGTISSVAFYQGSTLLGTDTSSPYSYSWTNVAAGTYSLTARATDNGGATTTSAARSITVSGGTNNPPTVSISSPANGATYTAPASVTINATAADSDGTVSSVAFYQGSTLLGTDTSSPYSYSWTNVAAGTYSLTARATDNGGAVTTSSAVSITVSSSGGTVPTYQAVGTAVSGTGAITVAWPTHQSGDVALLVVETANQAVTLSTPAGFAAVTNSPQGTGTAAGTSATRLTVFWKRATSSAEANPTVADSGDHQIARIITFRGVVASGNPWNVTAGNVASSASRTVSIPTVTTTVANTLVVAMAASATDTTTAQFSGWTNSALTSLTERIDSRTTSGNGGGFGVATGVKATAGATGTTTATLATSSTQGRMTIALRP